MRDVRQDLREYFRRWFFDDNFDLIAFYQPDGALAGFQLCYDKAGHEKALMWFAGRGLSHHHVDSGEQSPVSNRSPMFAQADGRTEMPRVLAEFRAAEEGVPVELKALVVEKIEEHGRRT